MPSRREIQQQVSEMQRDIRHMAQNDAVASGQLVPSVRELALKYRISHNVVAQALKTLAEEGVTYSVPRVGTFIGRPQTSRVGAYLLLLNRPETNSICQTIQIGFEERIAQLGGVCLALERSVAHDWHGSGLLPELSGVFEFNEIKIEDEFWRLDPTNPPMVRFGDQNPNYLATDLVDFDNFRGGQQAAQHLLDLGHRQIAFLGLHGQDNDPGLFLWSKEREEGWRRALESMGISTQGLSFLPEHPGGFEFAKQISAAHQSAVRMLRSRAATAVVATNNLAVQGLIQALRESGLPGVQWPAIVCFDNADINGKDAPTHITALRLPWEDIGRAAADLLWERSHGQADATHVRRLVPMRLITRLTCRRNWAQAPSREFQAKVPFLSANEI